MASEAGGQEPEASGRLPWDRRWNSLPVPELPAWEKVSSVHL